MSFRYNELLNMRIISLAFCNFAMYDYDSHLCEGDHLGKSRVWGAAYSPFIFYSSKLDKTLHSCDKCDSTFAAIATLRRHNCITRSRGGIKSNVFSLLLSIHVHLTKHDVSFASCGAKSKILTNRVKKTKKFLHLNHQIGSEKVYFRIKSNKEKSLRVPLLLERYWLSPYLCLVGPGSISVAFITYVHLWKWYLRYTVALVYLRISTDLAN